MSEFTLPVGPVHPAFKEPIQFKFKIEGEKIKSVDIDMGYNHRGIERAGMKRNPVQIIYLSERICGICSFSHPFSFSRAVENAVGIEVPERAHYIRTIIAELERLHSHLLWAGVAAHEIGFDTVLYLVWKNREKVMDICESITGNRVHYGVMMIGGVRRDLTEEHCQKLSKAMEYYNETLTAIEDVFLNEKTIKMRTQGIGILSKKDALALSAVGPTVRASGVPKDVRVDQPYAAYADMDVKPIVPEKANGDIFDRVWCRLVEVRQSIQIIDFCLQNIPKGDTLAEKNIVKLLADLSQAEGEGIGRHEAPRGECTHYVVLNKQPNPFTWKARAPTYNNVLPWVPMFKDAEIADIPIISASIDPCIACADRVTIVENNKTKTLNKIDLHKKSIEKSKRLKKCQ
ncbi:nickel-dependent hydrogenase large subunit [archaeon]|nr:nickel-dependent hydrogenase large subunit [archaeon]